MTLKAQVFKEAAYLNISTHPRFHLYFTCTFGI